jgi:hypothetical protein
MPIALKHTHSMQAIITIGMIAAAGAAVVAGDF